MSSMLLADMCRNPPQGLPWSEIILRFAITNECCLTTDIHSEFDAKGPVLSLGLYYRYRYVVSSRNDSQSHIV